MFPSFRLYGYGEGDGCGVGECYGCRVWAVGGIGADVYAAESLDLADTFSADGGAVWCAYVWGEVDVASCLCGDGNLLCEVVGEMPVGVVGALGCCYGYEVVVCQFV